MEDELNALLAHSPRFDRICIAVAFVKRSGVARIKPALNAFVQSGGSVEVVAGFDHRGTSKQGLEELLQITPDVFVFRDNRQDHTFHTKFYLFERTGAEAVAYVGSSNLTAGGLYSNYETNVRYELIRRSTSHCARCISRRGNMPCPSPQRFWKTWSSVIGLAMKTQDL
jgi:HKD family nuclease